MQQSPLIILNPTAGGSRSRHLAPRLANQLRHLAPDARLTIAWSIAETEELAEQAARDGRRRVVSVGGDGTVQAVVNGLLRGVGEGDDPPSLGIVPGGSGNDLARSLGLPRDPVAAMTVALQGETVPFDVGHASTPDQSRYFVSAAGIGFDAQVASRMNGQRSFWQRGTLGYLITAVLELRGFDNRPVRLALETPETERIEHNVLLAAVANGAYYGGGFKICPAAKTGDGLLDLCLVGDVSRLEALRQMPGLYRGAHVDHPDVEFRRLHEVRIEGDGVTQIHLDGEPFGVLPVTFAIRPAALRVAVPGRASISDAS
jgi:diacylglycerol kinase (ATP)